MLNLEGANVTRAMFCGIAIESGDDYTIMCKNEAAGELTADLGDGNVVTIPVCEDHLKLVSDQNPVYSLDRPETYGL